MTANTNTPPLSHGDTARHLQHCAIAVSDWLAEGCDAQDIPRPHIAALVTWTKETTAEAAAEAQPVQRETEPPIRTGGSLNIPDVVRRAALAAQPAQPVAVPQGATHYQPHQKTYYQRVSATEWRLWSDRYGWMQSKGTSDSSEWVTLEQIAAAPAAPAASTGWTGNADADLALILLDRLDDTGDGNAARIEQLEGLVRSLAAAPAAPAPAPAPMVLDVRCDFCDGSGLDSRDSNYACAPCNGRGFIERKFAAPAPALVPLTRHQVMEIGLAARYDGDDPIAKEHFIKGIRAAERAHGIGGKA